MKIDIRSIKSIRFILFNRVIESYNYESEKKSNKNTTCFILQIILKFLTSYRKLYLIVFFKFLIQSFNEAY